MVRSRGGAGLNSGMFKGLCRLNALSDHCSLGPHSRDILRLRLFKACGPFGSRSAGDTDDSYGARVRSPRVCGKRRRADIATGSSQLLPKWTRRDAK